MTSSSTTRGRGWAVATPHTTASDAAAAALRRGGNAIDAALAAAAVLTVVYPNQCSLGGDVIALVGLPDGSVRCVNGSGAAPWAVDLSAVREQHSAMPVAGAVPVTVPGVVAAWTTMAENWGSLPLGDALDTARQVADEGTPTSPGLARDLALEVDRVKADPGLSATFLQGGRPLLARELLRQPTLARTLARLRDGGARELYDGPIGASIIATLHENGSAMSARDFRDHRTRLVDPIGTQFRDREYLSAPPNSQGAFFLGGLRALTVLEGRHGRSLDPNGVDARPVAEIMSLLAWDRDRLLGDPADSDDLVESVLSGKRADEVVEQVLVAEAHPSVLTAVERPTGATGPRSGDTVAITVTDGRGAWVCLIQSTFHAFGSGILDPGTGIVLQNRGASFSLDPASPNRLGPGRLPQHTLMPVLVRERGTLIGAHGTMGGRAQPQVHTQVALNLENGMSPLDAVAQPRWILGAMEAGVDGPAPSRAVKAEQDVAESALRSLRDRGFATTLLPPHDDGAGHFQLVRTIDGVNLAASDPRADGSAVMG